MGEDDRPQKRQKLDVENDQPSSLLDDGACATSAADTDHHHSEAATNGVEPVATKLTPDSDQTKQSLIPADLPVPDQLLSKNARKKLQKKLEWEITGGLFLRNCSGSPYTKKKMKGKTFSERLFIPLTPVKRLLHLERHTHLWKDASASIL